MSMYLSSVWENSNVPSDAETVASIYVESDCSSMIVAPYIVCWSEPVILPLICAKVISGNVIPSRIFMIRFPGIVFIFSNHFL